jgi:anthranilate phosphoribosyltransferase
VHGGDGLDELTTTTCSTLWVYADGQIRRTELDPADLGLPRAELADLVGGDPAHNARVVRNVVAGAPGPVRDIVLLNAAAALVADAKPDPDDVTGAFATQLDRARAAVDTGAAQAKLQQWVELTRALR